MKGNSVQDMPAAESRRKIALLGAVGALDLAAHLRSVGAVLSDAEPAPDAASDHLAARFGYRRLSARTGDVGDLTVLVAILQSAKTGNLPADWIWRGADGQLRDGFRPSVEPDGVDDAAELTLLREAHLRALWSVLRDADELILVLSGDGCLVDAHGDARFPFDAAFAAYRPNGAGLSREFADMTRLNDDFARLQALLADLNPRLKLHLALLPVPTEPADFATRLPMLRHLSDLRVLMADWASALRGVSYLPIWEECTGPLARAGQYSAATGQVTAEGGAALARLCLGMQITGPVPAIAIVASVEPAAEDTARKRARRAERREKRAGKGAKPASVVCEEELLEAFSR